MSRTSNEKQQTPKALIAAAILAAVLIGFQLVALALVVAAEMVPDRLVADALVEGIEQGRITETEHPHTGLDNRVDRWTECIALTIGLGDPVDSNNLQTAITNPDIGRCQIAVPALLAYRDGAPLVSTVDYFRYWHGYTFVTRPSLALFGVAGTRVLAMALVVASIIAFALIVGRATSALAVVLLITPVLLSTDLVDLGESVPHALSMTVTWVGATTAWLLVRRRPTLVWMAVAGLIAGSLTAFIDLMVLFPGAWALVSGVILVAAYMDGWRGRRLFTAAVVAVSSWLLGFIFTWVSKWFIAGLTVGFGTMIDSVWNQVSFRVAGDHSLVADTFGTAATENVAYWLERPLGTLVVFAGLILAALFVVRGLRSGTMSAWSALVLAAPAGIPLVWYELLSNHSQIHFWITYKSLALALGALLFGLYVGSSPTSRPIGPNDTAPATAQEGVQAESAPTPIVEADAPSA